MCVLTLHNIIIRNVLVCITYRHLIDDNGIPLTKRYTNYYEILFYYHVNVCLLDCGAITTLFTINHQACNTNNINTNSYCNLILKLSRSRGINNTIIFYYIIIIDVCPVSVY